MYKLYAFWSAPKSGETAKFEEHYNKIHCQLALDVPLIRKLITTLSASGLEGSPATFYRVAEMIFNTKEDLEKSEQSVEWKKLREDAGNIISEFGVTMTVAMGNEQVFSK